MRGSRGGALFALGTGLAALALLTGGGGASAAPGGGGFNLATVTTISPDDTTYITAPSGDGTRLFIVGQQGRIWLYKNGALLPDPFLTMNPLPACCGERGLLSVAFAPNYETSGLFYIYYTQQSPELGAITIDEYKRSDANPDLADPASRRNVLEIDHSRGNHNGGQLQVGPDGYLYIGTGDGGGVGDPDLAGQNLNVLLGKILRIDPRLGPNNEPYTVPPDNPFVGQPPRMPEIWSYGLRNPWRFSFDRETGDLSIGDVGQNVWEEIDFSPRSMGYGRATNYGWSCREGRHDYNQGQPLCAGPPPPVLTEPVFEYPHSGGPHNGCSITGGYVIATLRSRRWSDATSTATTARLRSGTSSSRFPTRRATPTLVRTCRPSIPSARTLALGSMRLPARGRCTDWSRRLRRRTSARRAGGR